MSNYQQSEDTEQNQDMEDVLETFGLSPEPKKKESISRNASIQFLQPFYPQGSNSQGLAKMTSIQ